jgi:hypothetical protein
VSESKWEYVFQIWDECSGEWETRGSATVPPWERIDGAHTAEQVYSDNEHRWMRRRVGPLEEVEKE